MANPKSLTARRLCRFIGNNQSLYSKLIALCESYVDERIRGYRVVLNKHLRTRIENHVIANMEEAYQRRYKTSTYLNDTQMNVLVDGVMKHFHSKYKDRISA